MKKINIPVAIMMACVLLFSCSPDPDIIPIDPDNKHPIANAGPDQVINLPDNSTVLDGTASHDSDGFISLHRWTKIAGNDCFIESPLSAITNIKELTGGVYQFVLGVRDNGGLVSSDTVVVTVKNATGTCNTDDRPQINAILTEIGTLSQAGTPCVAAAGNKIFFAGTEHDYAGVDIYDITTHSWQRESLSQARANIAIAACGDKIFFAGGNRYDQWFDIVDIYDISDGNWTVAHLSEPKCRLAAASIGDKVFFAGGITEDGWNQTNRVDIYDISDNIWTIAELSEPKFGLSAVTAGNKIYFAGGLNYLNSGTHASSCLKSVDIYDASSNSWSIANLNFISGAISGVAHGDNIYWAGMIWPQYDASAEVWNIAHGGVTSSCLSYPRTYPGAAVKNDEIIFLTPGETEFSSDQFDIYNVLTGKWSIGLLDHQITAPGIISVNNKVYVGGGRVGNGYTTDKVYILSW